MSSAWADRYKDRGLWSSASFAPSFHSSTTSTMSAGPAREHARRFPIALDNDFSIWRAFHNQYWPALYIVDARGKIRNFQFGEGGTRPEAGEHP